MRVYLVFCHPHKNSFNNAVRQSTIKAIENNGHELRQVDLYSLNFNPVISQGEWTDYLSPNRNDKEIIAFGDDLIWADALIFVYPTWWYSLPALLKGWLDRVFVPGIAFELNPEGNITPRLTNITRLGVITTCGSKWLFSKWIGEPGRRLLINGIGALCHPKCKKLFLAQYNMDQINNAAREKFLEKVSDRIERFLK